MIFNSIEFIVFFISVFILYWFVFNKSLKNQNLLILSSSYFFYAWWDYRFLSLIIITTLVDYFVGININKAISKKRKKILFLFSIFFNLSLLGFFKYFNFFIDSWIDLFLYLGYEIKSISTLEIILPVGISFYTFQTMSYTIDVYRGRLKPTKDFISFASFISFFPQLVAGPIERASNLLPQILKTRKFDFDQSLSGLRLVIWGLFKKIIIADTLAPIVDNIFLNYEDYGGGTLWLGLIYFSFQIYCDFSGYSDVAIGSARLFGIKIMDNFRFPFFTRNIAEFWRKWHISLTSWFTDYFYFPLRLKYRDSGYIVNAIILLLYFALIGFWHGANWTFIAFGIYHGIFFLPTVAKPKYYALKTINIAENKLFPSLKEFLQCFTTFMIITIGWVFFRSESISVAINYLIGMFSDIVPDMFRSFFVYLIIPFILFEYVFFKNEKYILQTKNKYITIIESILIYYILYKIIFENSLQQFIYFQF